MSEKPNGKFTNSSFLVDKGNTLEHVAVVTGAAQEIGRAISEALLQNQVGVVGIEVNEAVDVGNKPDFAIDYDL